MNLAFPMLIKEYKSIWKGLLRACLLAMLLASPMALGKKFQLEVDGLACPFCAYGVEKKLKQTKGVEAVDIKINEGAILVTVAEEAPFDEAMCQRLIEEAGFTLRGFQEVNGSP